MMAKNNRFINHLIYQYVIAIFQIDEEQFNKIMEFINKGKDEGAQLKCGGNRFGSKGFYVEPTVFSDVTDNMKIAREEVR